MEAIQERAEQVLASVPEWLWDGERLPIPVEQIADTCFGLLIRDVEDMQAAPGAPELAPGQTLSGLLLPARGEIWVNADEARQWPPRRRFTIGHELGHLVMHATGQQALFCRSTSIDETVDTVPPPRAPDIEEEASVFAADLLMPAWHVVREHAQCRGDIETLCKVFDSSRRAMERRVADLFGAG